MARNTGVVVDGLNLNTVTDGVSWEFQSITGWHDGASVVVPQVQRVVDHGQFPQPGHRGGRMMIITGWLKTTSAQSTRIAAAIDQINALLADGGFGTFTFTDPRVGARWARVQLVAPPDVTWSGSEIARYQLTLLAPDSYKYGTVVSASTGFASEPEGIGLRFPLFKDTGVLSFGDISTGDLGVADVLNVGTAPAQPVFEIAGPTPADGFTITELGTGNVISYWGGVVPSGSTLVINSRDGSAWINGVADRSGDVVVTGAWPSVPADGARSYLFQPIGGTSAAVLTVSCTATYW